MENNLNRAPREESPNPSEKSPENNIESRIDEKIIDAISNGKWAHEDTENLLSEWQEIRLAELYRNHKKGIDDVELHVICEKDEIDLFKKAYNKIQTPEGKDTLKEVINEKVDLLYAEAKDVNYKDADSILDLIIK